MDADYTINAGDHGVTIASTLKDADQNAVDIQGATVTITATPVAGGTAILDAADATNGQTGDGTDGSKGKVSYTWTADDTATPGWYLAHWQVTFSAGAVETFPNDGFLLVHITDDTPVDTATRFADSSDLADRLGVTFTADEHTRAAALLAAATGVIQDETGQTISLVSGDVMARPGAFGDRVRLPQRPVVSVASVTLDETALDADSYYVDGDELVRLNLIGAANRFGGFNAGFGSPDQTLTITYTHGYTDVPQIVKTVTVEMVARVWINPGSVIQERVGPEETTFAPYQEPPRGLMMTDRERSSVMAVVGRAAGTVKLR